MPEWRSRFFDNQQQQLYRGGMRKVLVLFAIIFSVWCVQGATTSTPAIQDVRFSPPAVPTDLVIPPKVLSHPPAVYSTEARQRGIEGSVIVQAQFDEHGNFRVLKVVRGLGYGLDENALTALSNWQFSPALQNGLPVAAVAEIEVPFRMRSMERLDSQDQRTEITADLIERTGRMLYAKGNVLVQITSIQSGKLVSFIKADRVSLNLDRLR